MKTRAELVQDVKDAVNELIDPDVCGLEEALERLEEVQSDIDMSIDGINHDLARRDKSH